jgi:hypothetical protein
MPNDAKLGLVVGVGLVLVVAVVFFGKDLVPERAIAGTTPAVSVAPASVDQAEGPPTAHTASRTSEP